MADTVVPLIMCGGAGTRLWPASREGRPKQFLQLFGTTSTFQETVRRVGDTGLFARPIIVTSNQYRFIVAEQLREIGADADILLEPARRDSGPAIAAGAIFAQRRDGDPVMIALAADHVIADAGAFAAACVKARAAAADGRIVTFGIRPDRPATEFGYIRPGASIGAEIHAVDEFVEKPDEPTARRYAAEGYLWNSGNFMFRAGVLLDEYRAFEVASANAVADAVKDAGNDLGFVTLDTASFVRSRAVSIDYAVMERTARAAVMPVSMGWSDIGAWNAVWELSEKDLDGNAARGEAVFLDSENSYVATDKALVTMLGVRDLVVVASEDAILVARRQHAGEIRRLVQKLKAVAPKVTEEHLKVHRPWGSYQSLDSASRFQVKRIVVNPGGRLSLQLHHHRAEHWVVVRGAARVTVGETIKMLHENESIYIPIGTNHRLENPGKIELEIIEVQTGSYLGEDDIVRLQDDYQRK
ncbi:MAG: mannose-1-phosphate guanylyltransferase/mannose-6-phosphate isomerase [Proteobacteria bacterium]|nr:mannose-1-phosphate guanylyltransferase/mannose-6-phosphate isomerase [Pseudomonadota bacterium]